jgi:hypothetical protein
MGCGEVVILCRTDLGRKIFPSHGFSREVAQVWNLFAPERLRCGVQNIHPNSSSNIDEVLQEFLADIFLAAMQMRAIPYITKVWQKEG